MENSDGLSGAMSTANYPKLEQFLGAYFHQDWALVDPDSATVVAHYRKKNSARTLVGVATELAGLRAEKLKEPQLRRRLSELGCYFDPASERKTCTQWILWLQKSLADESPKKTK